MGEGCRGDLPADGQLMGQQGGEVAGGNEDGGTGYGVNQPFCLTATYSVKSVVRSALLNQEC